MKKIASLFFALILGLACLGCGAEKTANTDTSVATETNVSEGFYAPTSGTRFEGLPTYATVSATERMPLTVECWVKLSGTNENSPIYGNVNMKETKSFSFMVLNDMPALRLTALGEIITFEASKLTLDEWVHLAIAVDVEGNQLHCYKNGEMSETKPLSDSHIQAINEVEFDEEKYSHLTMVGGGLSLKHDVRVPFNGEIGALAVYSDTRTAAEIAEDYKQMNAPDQNDLMLAYLFEESGLARYEDLSSNHNDLSWGGYGFLSNEDLTIDPNKPDTYDYSIMVIGDTQILTESSEDKNGNWKQYDLKVDYYNTMYKWLVDNKERKKIKMVIGVGDITNNNMDVEWESAMAAFSKLDEANITHLPVLGNHDVDITRGIKNPEDYYKNYLKAEDYEGIVTHKRDMKAYYYPFEIGEHKYLFFGMGYKTTQEEVDWARDIIQNNADCNVIISTHSYLEHGGVEPLEEEGAMKLREMVLECSNIVLVLCGHRYDNEAVVYTETRADGSTVQALMTNPQRINRYLFFGIATGLYFTNDGKTVHIANHVTGTPGNRDVYLGWKEKSDTNSAVLNFELDLIENR